MKKLLLLSVVWMLVSCGKSTPELNGVDLDVWKADPKACGNKRMVFANALETEKEKLKALSEMQIVELLGKADETELYKRNQKFLYYYLAPGPDCTAPDSSALRLIIRFNAIGLAKEISIE